MLAKLLVDLIQRIWPPTRTVPYFLMFCEGIVLSRASWSYSTRMVFSIDLKADFRPTPFAVLSFEPRYAVSLDVFIFLAKFVSFLANCMGPSLWSTFSNSSVLWLSLLFSFRKAPHVPQAGLLSYISSPWHSGPIMFCFGFLSCIYFPLTLGICSDFKPVSLFKQRSTLKMPLKLYLKPFSW